MARVGLIVSTNSTPYLTMGVMDTLDPVRGSTRSSSANCGVSVSSNSRLNSWKSRNSSLVFVCSATKSSASSTLDSASANSRAFRVSSASPGDAVSSTAVSSAAYCTSQLKSSS
eukprot:Gregarina_sp_Pseudo_9__5238@NODE_58_length_4716_cov_37_865298_g54_i0_p6_GENE_NODE_58_length_4716_cov_37_865298_g54_i0NODE_58_length_4716_cov_37_865298_g54_i0_p6_ORF_typecomplete_len114_score28_15DUF2110/PF09883_9/0_11_NODE_58_length_4716_cov_37_865298_g54_i0159500